MSKIIVIGSGFSGLSAANYLSQAGHEVHVFEKNAEPGGRARQLRTEAGYVFDMGPSWYWMPDVFERFFNDFGSSVAEHYELQRLDPSFEVIFGKGENMKVPDSYAELCLLFESIEPGSARQLEKFMAEAEFKYKAGMENLVYMPGLSISELMKRDLIMGVFRLQVFSSFGKHVRKYFSNPKLIALMEFPILFLGAMPQDTPALYSLMNYAGLKLGTWYPKGGFGKVINAMVSMAKVSDVTFHLDSPVEKIAVEDNLVTHVISNGLRFDCDAVIATADYQHVEQQLLEPQFRNYDEKYWEKKTFAPSCLIFYLGIRKKIKTIEHHTLFFEENIEQHARDIYKEPRWPAKPLFYVCCPSRTDDTVAPQGHENLFILMPVAPGLEDGPELREKYFGILMTRLEEHIGEEIASFIDYRKDYCVSDFSEDYNAYKGNAYGLANTLSQTAILKPGIRNRELSNLIYAGQLTVPGPGVPPSIISGKIAAGLLIKQLQKNHEIII